MKLVYHKIDNVFFIGILNEQKLLVFSKSVNLETGKISVDDVNSGSAYYKHISRFKKLREISRGVFVFK